MKTKCPHCGAEEKLPIQGKRHHFKCESYYTEGYQINRSNECCDAEEIQFLTSELNAWKAAAMALRDEFVPNTIEHPAVALYEAAAEKYGI